MMSAQKGNQPSTSQSTPKGEQTGRQTSLARPNVLPSVPSLLLDPLGFFDDSPFGLLRRMQQEMSRVFGQSGGTSQGGNSNPVWAPPIEVAYRDGNLVVSAELPGLKDEDIAVAIQDNAIVIQGEREVEQEEDEGGIHRTELRYGRFYRAIPLPEGAKTEQARAEFNNGVLKISVPVPQEQSNSRQLPIETGTSSQGTSSKSAEEQSSSTGSSTTKKAA
jgi:HSP20 family protein